MSKKSLLWSAFFILCACLPTVAQPTSEGSQFKGWVFYQEDSGPQEFLVLRNAQDLKAFRKRIPKKAPSKKRPAPDNKDPLLADGAVDFGKHILVLALRGQTISAHPRHLATESQADRVLVKFSLPEPPPEARPYGWGVYRGLIIPKTSKTIVVKFD